MRACTVPTKALRPTGHSIRLRRTRVVQPVKAQQYPDFIPTQVRDICEPATGAFLARAERVKLDVPGVGDVNTAFVGHAGNAEYAPDVPAVVFLHGFDGSCVEFRRLHPLVEKQLPCYSVDLAGWGYTDAGFASTPLQVVGPDAKRAHLHTFVQVVVQRPVLLVGSSLGGAAALDFAMSHPQAVSKMLLIDPQISVDGIGPLGVLPRPLALLGVDLLRSEWLRNNANQLAYHNKARFATLDAMLAGRLHTYLPGWRDAIASFMKSGGYRVASRLRQERERIAHLETRLLWGDHDEILGTTAAAPSAQQLPNCQLVWIPECGHCGHLEQPEFVAEQIFDMAGVAQPLSVAAAAAAPAAGVGAAMA